MAEATPDPTPTPEGAGADTGPKSDPPKEPAKVPDEAYVKALRKEAAENRKALEAATARLRELEDRDKSDLEKAAQRATESERRATEAEAKLLRVQIAAEKNMPASAVALLTGTTREEIEASAASLAAYAQDLEKKAPGFDGGARRDPPPAEKKPELAHNDWLLAALGRAPSSS